jgi:DNA invertase Pin-like site-specific DNA recombinase
MTDKKTLLGYRRKSMVRYRADLISPERQMRSCELWLEMQNLDYTIEWYEDIDGHRSGREEKGRPGWQNLMSQLDRPDVVGVIADSFDRTYRNVHQFLNFLNRLEAINKNLVTVKEGLDTSSTLGRAIVTILMVIYQLESDQTSDRMTANVKYKREVLGRHWGPTPFGCDRNDEGQLVPTQKTYWLNPLTSEASSKNIDSHWEERRYYDGLIELYRSYSSAVHSYDEIAAQLNQAGWRYCAESDNHQPRPFTRDDVRRVTSFWRLYRGELPTGNITRGDGPILAGGHAPILPVDLCNLAGQVRERRSKQYNRRKNDKYFYMLTGVIYCSVCQRALAGNTQDGRRIYRHYPTKRGCNQHSLYADDIEPKVLTRIADMGNADLLTEIRAEADRIAREVFAADDTGRAHLAELDRQRERLKQLEDLYMDKDIDKTRYRERKGEIDSLIADLEDKLYQASQTINFNHVIDRMLSTLAAISQASPETKKTLINSIYERIEVADGQIIHTVPRPWAKPFF